MAINPLGSHGPSNTGAHRAGESPRQVDGVGAGATPAGSTDAVTGDQVQLSDLAAAAGASGAVPTGELSPDALRAITQKLASGAYDAPAVADRIAGKLLTNGEVLPPA